MAGKVASQKNRRRKFTQLGMSETSENPEEWQFTEVGHSQDLGLPMMALSLKPR